jgi:hypothetical protein
MPRARQLTFDLLGVERRAQGVVVDLEFVNGSSQWYRTVVTRVTVHGPAGQRVDQDLPIGGLRSGQEKRVRVRFDEVPFDPADVTVDLLYALP